MWNLSQQRLVLSVQYRIVPSFTRCHRWGESSSLVPWGRGIPIGNATGLLKQIGRVTMKDGLEARHRPIAKDTNRRDMRRRGATWLFRLQSPQLARNMPPGWHRVFIPAVPSFTKERITLMVVRILIGIPIRPCTSVRTMMLAGSTIVVESMTGRMEDGRLRHL